MVREQKSMDDFIYFCRMAGKLRQKNEESGQESSPCVGQCDVSCARSSAQKCQTVISTAKYDIKTPAIILLDHGVIKCFKMEYRQCALRHVIACMNGCERASELSKKISVRDALDWIKTSWEKIGQELITKCFVSYGISSREVERQLDLFDESTAEDQLAELSKLAGIECDPKSLQHEAAVECFDDYSADWEEPFFF
ncbi:hypothetical protein AVEN_231650-1 [Araneus ventricosus]|uniref:DDE-1 domain-containing protein n=1 Tax=Araneus ventricosus TaxID=182803 RepID=A0A4Y2QRT2_ARAVE|nr:hypothetical protein AVEN_231650-1 [Araneus ventricosus]